MDPKKIKAVQEWQTPADVTQVRSFLGLANYFRRFVQGFSAIAAPLVHLTRADIPFEWTHKQVSAFCHITHALITAPVLKLPNPDLLYEVIADASINGIGAVLVQERHPVAYYSRKFSPAERNYTTGEQELLAQQCTAAMAMLSRRPRNYSGNRPRSACVPGLSALAVPQASQMAGFLLTFQLQMGVPPRQRQCGRPAVTICCNEHCLSVQFQQPKPLHLQSHLERL